MLSSIKFYSSCFLLLFAFVVMPGCGEEQKINQNSGGTGVEPATSANMDRISQGPASDPVDFVDGKPTQKFDPTTQPKTEEPKTEEPKTEEPKADEPKAAADDEGFGVAVADGALNFTAPSTWKKMKPRSPMLAYEIAIPKSEGEADDAADGRLTIMGAGGSVEANLERWYGQYTQPDGGSTKDATKVVESKVGDCEVTWVDMSGTMLDKPGGPMSGGKVVEREGYRTLAAIVQAGEHGQYFVKVYGPKKTLTDNEAAFKAFVESLKINDEAKGL